MGTPKARILAIDDQLYFRSFLEGMLCEEGFSVRTEPGGPGVLEVAERHGPFDLVILDLAMAETDGMALVSKLRERFPALGVIAISSVGDVRSVVEAMRHGAADYLLKPIDRESLLKSIASVLENRRRELDSGRLVDENLQFMGRISELERALPLVGTTDLPAAAQGVLELLCSVAGSDDGVLWVGDLAGRNLSTAAASGRANGDTLPRDWVPEDDAIPAAMSAGKWHRAGEVLHVPCMRSGELVAVARLGAEGGLAADAAEACTRLSGISALVLWNARQLTARSVSAGRAGDGGYELLRDPDTALPSRSFFDLVLEVEVHKAQRYGRRLSCICVDASSALASDLDRDAAVAAVARTLRTSDCLASEDGNRFWVLVTDNDALGGVVLKRRLADRVCEALSKKAKKTVAVGMATYPQDGESAADLCEHALANVDSERESIVHALGLRSESSLVEMADRLLRKAPLRPEAMVAEVAELMLGELSSRPRDRGLLFLAPGSGGSSSPAPPGPDRGHRTSRADPTPPSRRAPCPSCTRCCDRDADPAGRAPSRRARTPTSTSPPCWMTCRPCRLARPRRL